MTELPVPTVVAIDRDRIAAAVTEILFAIGEDPNRAGLKDTPRRVASAYADFFAGMQLDPQDSLVNTVSVGLSVDGAAATSEAVVLRDIEFRSVCEHHLLPFVGVAHVAYIPKGRVVGLGQLPALIDSLARRPQLQERLTEEIADALAQGLQPLGVLVVLEAEHRCVTTRGTRQARSSMATLASRGVLTEPLVRADLMHLIRSGKDA